MNISAAREQRTCSTGSSRHARVEFCILARELQIDSMLLVARYAWAQPTADAHGALDAKVLAALHAAAVGAPSIYRGGLQLRLLATWKPLATVDGCRAMQHYD